MPHFTTAREVGLDQLKNLLSVIAAVGDGPGVNVPGLKTAALAVVAIIEIAQVITSSCCFSEILPCGTGYEGKQDGGSNTCRTRCSVDMESNRVITGQKP